MDAFEQVVKTVLEGQGWWVRQGYKVVLTREEKLQIGRASSPRWEIDLVAYRPKTNEVLAIECKSYLDSFGVSAKEFLESESPTKGRYKLFNEPTLRHIVLARLQVQLADESLIGGDCTTQLALAVGKFRSSLDREMLRDQFKEKGWRLIDDLQLREWVIELADRGYEDSIATIVSKLIVSAHSATISNRRDGV